jgi:two-component system phosphate regulon sensor histidine kinase PhoR
LRLRSRLTLLLALLAAGAAGALMILWSAVADRASEGQAIRRLRAEDSLLADVAAPLFSDPAGIDRLVRSAGASLGVRITVIAADGRVLSDSDVAAAEVPRMENHASRPEIAEAGESGRGQAMRFSDTLDRNFVYLARRIPASGPLVGFVRLAIAVDEIHAEESPILWAGRAAIVSACGILFLVGAAASRRLAVPLERVSAAAAEVAGGNLAREIPEENEPDAASLAGSVRRMKATLLAALAAAESEQRSTAEVFDRLPSAVVVVGERGEIAQANRAFQELAGSADPVGRPLVDLLREPAIHRLFSEAIDRQADQSVSWRRPDSDATWDVRVLPLGEGGRRAIGIFRNVTSIARNEAMRRQFVSDVSHELRTPIASIVTAAETLAEGIADEEETAELEALIVRQALRMRDLVEDLTDLSRIESGSIELRTEDVDLADVSREVAHDLAGRAAERRISVIVAAPAESTVRGDRRRLHQIVQNLADNAVKFSPDGGRVEIALGRDGDRVTLSVSDEGPGVLRSEREKIFQRFYQTDPSRSKVRPGTGLGLAIVKHLAILHQATIEVGGDPGRGATFRVSFPAVV